MKRTVHGTEAVSFMRVFQSLSHLGLLWMMSVRAQIDEDALWRSVRSFHDVRLDVRRHGSDRVAVEGLDLEVRPLTSDLIDVTERFVIESPTIPTVAVAPPAEEHPASTAAAATPTQPSQMTFLAFIGNCP